MISYSFVTYLNPPERLNEYAEVDNGFEKNKTSNSHGPYATTTLVEPFVRNSKSNSVRLVMKYSADIVVLVGGTLKSYMGAGNV